MLRTNMKIFEIVITRRESENNEYLGNWYLSENQFKTTCVLPLIPIYNPPNGLEHKIAYINK